MEARRAASALLLDLLGAVLQRLLRCLGDRRGLLLLLGGGGLVVRAGERGGRESEQRESDDQLLHGQPPGGSPRRGLEASLTPGRSGCQSGRFHEAGQHFLETDAGGETDRQLAGLADAVAVLDRADTEAGMAHARAG